MTTTRNVHFWAVFFNYVYYSIFTKHCSLGQVHLELLLSYPLPSRLVLSCRILSPDAVSCIERGSIRFHPQGQKQPLETRLTRSGQMFLFQFHRTGTVSLAGLPRW